MSVRALSRCTSAIDFLFQWKLTCFNLLMCISHFSGSLVDVLYNLGKHKICIIIIIIHMYFVISLLLSLHCKYICYDMESYKELE